MILSTHLYIYIYIYYIHIIYIYIIYILYIYYIHILYIHSIYIYSFLLMMNLLFPSQDFFIFGKPEVWKFENMEAPLTQDVAHGSPNGSPTSLG